MPGHILFVRFFLNCPASLPFERIIHLNDAAIGDAIKELLKEHPVSPAQGGKNFTIAEWNAAATVHPDGPRAATPSGRRLKHSPDSSEALPNGILRRCPVARFDSEQDAKDAATAIQERVAELARACGEKRNWKNEDWLLGTANPRFFVVAEKDLSRAELAGTIDRLERVSGPVAENATIEEGLLRFFLPKIQGTLAQLDKVMASPDADRPRQPKPRGKGSANQRMLEELQADPEARGWNCREWAAKIKCAKSTVTGTETWKDLELARSRNRSERAIDRRRRTSSRRRD